ncbi:MAG: PEP-CTERM sorting domain-containing protein [Cyanobacteria bacterium J06659_2]
MPNYVFNAWGLKLMGGLMPLAAIAIAEPPAASAASFNPIDLDESWSFAFEDYAIEHQGQSLVDITVSYDYVDGIGLDDPFEYPEFLQIFNYIDNFLVTYPNETDFWEILNKNLVTDLLTEPIPTVFGFDYQLSDVLDSLTVDIAVASGSSDIVVPRTSTVTGIPGATVDLFESWSFALEDYAIEHQGQSTVDLTVSYDYVNGIGEDDPFEYPEFLQISNFIETFLTDYPNETDFWEILNKNLVTDLLSEPIPTVFGFDYQLAEVLDQLTVDIDVQPGSSDIVVPRSSMVTGTVVASADVPEPRLWLGLGIVTVLAGWCKRKR